MSNYKPEPFLDSMIGLVSPFAGIHNLDLSSDSLPADGVHLIWGQLTPHDGSSYDSVPVPNAETCLIRSYRSEAEMYGRKKSDSKCGQRLMGQSALMRTIFISIHTCLYYHLQWCRSMKTSQLCSEPLEITHNLQSRICLIGRLHH
jgi:hypothetical protein